MKPALYLAVMVLFCATPLIAQLNPEFSLTHRANQMPGQIDPVTQARLHDVVMKGARLPLPDALQLALDSARAIYALPGVSAAMIIPGYGLWLGTSGYSDPAIRDTITTDMLFGIGSNTKSFIASTMLELRDEGVLSLDDSLHEWLPTHIQEQYHHIDSNVTIRQLLNHTSGLSDYMTWYNLSPSDTTFWMPESLLAKFVLADPAFPAGTQYQYSNTNYLLAGMIIKAATGNSVSKELHQRFLEPLNLNHTFLAIEDSLAGVWAEPPPGNPDGHTIPMTSIYSFAWTAGGMFSTPTDLVQWIWNLVGGNVLKPTSLAEMLTFTPQSGYSYGLGVGGGRFHGNTWFGHAGNWNTYNSEMDYFANAHVSVAHATNTNYFDYGDVSVILIELFLQHEIDVASVTTQYQPGTDTVWLSGIIANRQGHAQTVSAVVKTAATTVDSFALYNDGLHRDGLPGDSIWGAYILTPATEEIYRISVSRFDGTDSTTLVNDMRGFTTAGPLTLDSVAYKKSIGYNYTLTPFIRNNGSTYTVRGGTLRLSCKDPWVKTLSASALTLPDLPPGGLLPSTKTAAITYDGATYGGCFHVTAEILVDGIVYWQDSVLVRTTGVGDRQEVPVSFALEQNFPNPFNPSTTISFSVPNVGTRHVVSLQVFDVLGRVVATLVNERKAPGRYEVEFDAARLSSGVYFYRLEAGSFVETRRMILVR